MSITGAEYGLAASFSVLAMQAAQHESSDYQNL